MEEKSMKKLHTTFATIFLTSALLLSGCSKQTDKGTSSDISDNNLSDSTSTTENESSTSSENSESGSDIDTLIENFPVDNITFPDGSSVSKLEAAWASDDNATYQLGFDYSFIRYAKAPLYTTLDDPGIYDWETGKFVEKGRVEQPEYFKVKAGDKLDNGLTVKSAEYRAVSGDVEYPQSTVTFYTEVEYEGKLTLSGVLYCYSGDNEYIIGRGKYMFFADPSQSDPLPITSMDFINSEGKMGPLDHEDIMGSSFAEDSFAALGEYVSINFYNHDEIRSELSEIVSDGEAKRVSITIDNISSSFALTVMRVVRADLVSIEAI